MQPTTLGDVSFWYADIGLPQSRRPALRADAQVDVAIIGAGYTGLWTAYYLKKAQPDLRVAIADHLADGTLTYFAPYAAVHAQNLERVRAALG